MEDIRCTFPARREHSPLILKEFQESVAGNFNETLQVQHGFQHAHSKNKCNVHRTPTLPHTALNEDLESGDLFMVA